MYITPLVYNVLLIAKSSFSSSTALYEVHSYCHHSISCQLVVSSSWWSVAGWAAGHQVVLPQDSKGSEKTGGSWYNAAIMCDESLLHVNNTMQPEVPCTRTSRPLFKVCPRYGHLEKNSLPLSISITFRMSTLRYYVHDCNECVPIKHLSAGMAFVPYYFKMAGYESGYIELHLHSVSFIHFCGSVRM